MITIITKMPRQLSKRHATIRRAVCGAVVGALGLLGTASASAQDFFKYKDKSGTVVISHTVPAERVPYGYEIVDETLRVIRRVEPQLSKAEYQKKLAREQAMADCEEQLKRVNKAYQTQEDIDNAERQSLASIDTSVNNARANLSHVQNQRKALEAQAAQKDLEGSRIPNDLLDNIASARAQEQNLEDEIDMRLQEKLNQRIHYRYDRKIFELNTCDNGLPSRS